MKEAGLCDQAIISVQGEDEAKKEQADNVSIYSAAGNGRAGEVQLVLDFYPDRVNSKDQVTVPDAPRAAADSVSLLDGQRGDTPLHEAVFCNHCEVAKILIAAGADLNVKNMVRQSLARLSCCCC